MSAITTRLSETKRGITVEIVVQVDASAFLSAQSDGTAPCGCAQGLPRCLLDLESADLLAQVDPRHLLEGLSVTRLQVESGLVRALADSYAAADQHDAKGGAA